MFDSLDLRPFVGWRIDEISFFKVSNWTHVIYIWEKKQDEAMNVIYSQEVPDEAPFGLNTVQVDEELLIDPKAKYWIGVRITHHQGQQGYMYPFGVVRYDGVDGKSNLIMDASENSHWEINPYPYYHFWIRMALHNPQETTFEGKSLVGYEIYRDGESIRVIPYAFVTYFDDTEFSRGFDHEYCVVAVYNDGVSEEVCATATLTSVRNDLLDDTIFLSPNPVGDVVRINGDGAIVIEVYNLVGQKVFEHQGDCTLNLDVTGWNKGLYIVNIIKEDKNVIVGKLLVN